MEKEKGNYQLRKRALGGPGKYRREGVTPGGAGEKCNHLYVRFSSAVPRSSHAAYGLRQKAV